MGQDYTDEAGKIKHHDNPFIEPVQTQTVVDMKGKLKKGIHNVSNFPMGQILGKKYIVVDILLFIF